MLQNHQRHSDYYEPRTLMVVPQDDRGRWYSIIGLMVVLMPLILWLLAGLTKLADLRPRDIRPRTTFAKKKAPKPPDPKDVEKMKACRQHQRRLKKLAQMAALMLSLPHVHRSANATEIQANMAQCLDLDPPQRDKVEIRRQLFESKDQVLLSTVDGLKGICDSGCSGCATFDKADFVQETFQQLDQPRTMNGIAGGLTITGQGQLRYEVIDNHGAIRTLEAKGWLIPDLPCRLLSPQQLFPHKKIGRFEISGDDCSFRYTDGSFVNVPLDSTTGLPTVVLYKNADSAASQLETSMYSCVTNERNQNLTPTQKETLKWHWRLGHPAAQTLTWLAQRGLLGNASSRISKILDHPKCATCQYGKQTRKPIGSARQQPRAEREGVLKGERLEPGDCIAADQFVVTQRGRLFGTGGKETETDKFSGGTIFVDFASGYTRVYFQVSLDGPETIRAKQQFEREARSHGVIVKNYRTDNGIFTKEEFIKELSEKGQGITVSGVGAHHQNALAERAIRTTVTKARTMLLHAQLRWPDHTNVDLWPMAMQHASYLNNVIPRTDVGLSPEELFARSKSSMNKLDLLPVWGCPTYVLQPTLQDGKKLPKWKPRSRRAQYLGWSTMHSSNVALVRNLNTGRISPQFHVVFDNWFETVDADDDYEVPPEWDVIISKAHYEVEMDETDDVEFDLSDEWLTKEELAERREIEQTQNANNRQRSRRQRPQTTSGTDQQQPQQIEQQLPERQNVTPQVPAQQETTTPNVPSARRPQTTPAARRTPSINQREPNLNPVARQLPIQSPPRRSRRATKGIAPQRWGFEGDGIAGYLSLLNQVAQDDDNASVRATVAYWTLLECDPETGLLDDFHPGLTPIALKASKVYNPDLPNFRDAMSGQHREQFIAAMQKEIRELEGKGTWNGVLRASLLPNTKTVPLTWVFRIKRLPNGDFDKFKARLCVRGDLQFDNVETYAPVIRWATIRSVLAFAIKHDMKTRQVDFSNAFVQATLPKSEQIYLELPQMGSMNGDDVVLKLEKSLYGLKQAPLHWFKLLRETLLKQGFHQSKNDSCLFIHNDRKLIVLVYTDDCLLFGFDDESLDELVKDLKEKHELTEQEVSRDVYAYLGIELNMSGSKVMLLQNGLTDKVLKTVSMQQCNPTETPATEQPLRMDQDGERFNESWDYASVVGMLMYLVNTRPDIQFAVHQCARYTHCPRQSHANAIKKICRYLQGTRGKGICFEAKPSNPNGHLQVNCYVDADFAGRWNIDNPMDPSTARSRTGYVILIDDCPITWCSKLQDETALSTTEAEYIALSWAMRELLWARRVVAEVADGLNISYNRVAKIKSKVFEDNQGAIAIAHKPALTSRTKHIHTKYHHFKEHIGTEKGIEIEHVGTEEQIADIFTKGLGNTAFIYLRDKLMGWIPEQN